MSTGKKRTLAAGGACIAVGAALILVVLAWARFDLGRLSTVKFETTVYLVPEAFQSLDIRTAECDVRLLPAQDGQCQVVCAQMDKVSHTVQVRDGVLTVARTDTRRWYERMGLWWGGEDLAVTVYLPERAYQSLRVKTVSGGIQVPEDFTFASAEAESTSGDISFLAVTDAGLRLKSTSGAIRAAHAAGGTVQAATTSGGIQLSEITAQTLTVDSTSGAVRLTGVTARGSVSVNTTSGAVRMERVSAQALSAETASGKIELRSADARGEMELRCVSGGVELEDADAGSIRIKTTSGGVTGSLRSPKNFTTHTSSGTVRVPAPDSAGGPCDVTTTSGDITISVAP